MKKRTLISGRKVSQLKDEINLTISSKCPDKWLFVDLETGDIWHSIRDVYEWRQETLEELQELKMVTDRALATKDYSERKKERRNNS